VQVLGSLDAALPYGESACRWAPVGVFDLAVFYSGRFSQVYYDYGAYGYYGWYPIYDGEVSDGRVEFDYAYWDYE